MRRRFLKPAPPNPATSEPACWPPPPANPHRSQKRDALSSCQLTHRFPFDIPSRDRKEALPRFRAAWTCILWNRRTCSR